MASFVIRSLDFLEGAPHTTDEDFFADDSAPHEASINAAASLGIVAGSGSGTYGPNEPITRAATASVVARALAYEVEGTTLQPPPHVSWRGEAVATRDYKTLVVYDFASGSTRTLVTTDTIVDAVPSPRGDRVLFRELRGQWNLIRTDGTGFRPLRYTPRAPLSPVWHPNGREVAAPADFGVSRIAVFDVDSDALRVLSGSDPLYITDGPIWSPDGATIGLAGSAGDPALADAQPTWHLRTMRASDGSIVSDRTGPFFGYESAQGISLSPRPDRALFPSKRGDDLFGVVADPRSMVPSFEIEQFPWDALWSPGGSRAVWTEQSGPGTTTTYVLDARTGVVSSVAGYTRGGLFAWSTDGTTLISKQCGEDPQGGSLAYCNGVALIDVVTGDVEEISLPTRYDSWRALP